MSVLKDFTREKHIEAESTDFVQYMFSGDITKQDYIQYLQQMHHIYSEIEYFGEISLLFTDMQDLKRSEKILKDLHELGAGTAEALPSVKKYKEHIQQLYYTKQADKIMAHIYVRHMGDLYGGKVIAKRIPGSGYAYQFEDRPAMITALNSKLTLDLVDEALAGFDYCIQIFKELK